MAWQNSGFDTDPRVAQILTIVAKEAALDRAKLTRDATIEELGIDSLDLTMTVFQLETTFDISIPAMTEQAGAEFATVGDLVRHVIAAMDKVASRTAATDDAPKSVAGGAAPETAEAAPKSPAPGGTAPHRAAANGSSSNGATSNGIAPTSPAGKSATEPHEQPASEASGTMR